LYIPLTFRAISVAFAVAAITLHITAELSSPYYGRTNLFLNRKKLRNAALITAILFLTTVAIQIYMIVS
jgi:cytosine/uracil/thiamine/allantoin permease